MLEMSQMPLLPGQNNGRDIERIAKEDLNSVGVNGSAFGVFTDDVIEFPNEDPLVVFQRINDSENSPKAFYVGIYRNGKPSWLSVGLLTRRDHEGRPIGKLQELLCTKASFADICDELKGKTIKGGAAKKHLFTVFKDGQRTDELRERLIPELIMDKGW